MPNVNVRSTRRGALLGLIVLAGLLSGCSGGAATVASSWPGLAADETTVYIAYAQAVHAVDLVTGQERWRFPAESDNRIAFYAPPALTDDGGLIVGGYDNVVRRLNANGSEVWHFSGAAGRIIGGAALAGELALVPSADHTLYALNAESGALVWSFEASHALWATPVVDGERVYLASLDHRVYALDLADGSLIWERELGAAMAGSPAFSDGQLLVGTFGAGLQALRAQDGTPVWSFDSDGWIWGSPTVSGRAAYFGDVAGTMYALDLDSQSEL